MKFELEFCEDDEEVKYHIRICEGNHIQQIVYSSYHDALTQVCFGCKKIRTSLKAKDVEPSFHELKIEGVLSVGNGEKCPFCDEILDDRIEEGMIHKHLFGKHEKELSKRVFLKKSKSETNQLNENGGKDEKINNI